MKNCCVFGLGYIGLPTSAILANAGHNVIGVDIKKDIVKSLNSGNIHLKEKGLKKLILEALNNKKFLAKTIPVQSDVFIIAVPTPIIKVENKIPKPNMKYVFDAINSICEVIKENDLLILESTSPIGTTEKIAKIIKEKTGLGRDKIDICYCPERVLPGNIIYELKNNNRVIGGLTYKATEKGVRFYESFCKGKLSKTDAKTAEMVKLTENSFRDVNIAFANELSMISNEIGIDCERLIELANMHPRVNILNPSCGVGGHCIAIDPWFIVSAAPKSSKLISKAREVNDYKTDWIYKRILENINQFKEKDSKKITIGILGITFKPNVEDIRESPALKIAFKLIKDNFNILVAEPNLESVEGLKIEKLDSVISKSEIIIILVGHKEFYNLNLKNDLILDYCGLNKKE